MKYAVIESGGKQYKVEEGKELVIDKLKAAKDEKVNFDRVLFIRDGEAVHVGQPYLTHARVTGKIIGEEKGTKIRVAKFKSKVRYRRVMGFRSRLTRIMIESVSLK
jgi:large subunit ribosomal protein L21